MDIIELVKSHNLTKLKEIDAEDIKNAECDSDGLTPLHWSSRKGFLDVVEFLVELANSGYTALYEAALQHHYEIVSFLLSSNANINLQDAHGRSVLHITCENGDEKTALLCIKNAKDVNINIKDMFERTALHWACKQGYETLVTEFLSRGADVNLKTKGGDTPLHWASHNGHEKLCKVLLSHGADATLTNTKDETADQVATSPQLRKLLEDAITQKVMEKSKETETQQQQNATNTTTAPNVQVRMVAKPPPKKLKITLKK